MLQTYNDLKRWVIKNPDHPHRLQLETELMVIHYNRLGMHSHLKGLYEEIGSKTLEEKKDGLWALDIDLTGKKSKQIHSLFEKLAVQGLKDNLLRDGNSPIAVALGMCNHDFFIYQEIRNTLDFCNELLNT